MDRERALMELKSRLKNQNMIKHCLAVESIMRAFGRFYKDDEEKWGITGLLHDIDTEKTAGDPERHGLVSAEILESLGVDEHIIYAIKSHNELHGLERKRKLDRVLFSADPLSGLIAACALVLPSKKISDITVEFVMNRMDEKGFAQGANRANIRECSKLDISLEEFIKISLDAMKSVAKDIGL